MLLPLSCLLFVGHAVRVWKDLSGPPPRGLTRFVSNPMKIFPQATRQLGIPLGTRALPAAATQSSRMLSSSPWSSVSKNVPTSLEARLLGARKAHGWGKGVIPQTSQDPPKPFNRGDEVIIPSPDGRTAFAVSSALTLKGAKQSIEAGIAEATKCGFKVTIAVVDGTGELMALERMDGCMPVGTQVATGKAKSALLFARETKMLEGSVNGEKSSGAERIALLSSGQVLMEGGVPIIDPAHGKIVGACGVSGVKPAEDAQVAKAAVAALSASKL